MTITYLITATRDLCDADSTSMPMAALTDAAVIWLNESYKRVVAWLINADGTAQFDDTNYTDFPIGTYTMVASQAKYSFNDKFLQLVNVQAKDINGDWVMLKPIDQSEYNGVLEEDFETDGMPEYYDKLSGDTIKLYPAPSATYATLTLGLRIYFKRTASTFTAAEITAGTKEPGFAINHEILAYMTSLPYCEKYHKDRVALYQAKIGDLDPDRPTGMKAELINHYSKYEKDKRKQITFKRRAFK